MATLPCPNKVLCPSLDGNPLTNYSSEDPDPAIRLGYSTGTSRTNFGRGGSAGTGNGGDPPALGSDWDNKSVLEIVEVTDPDVDPDDEAGNALIDLLVDDTTPGAGGWKTPPGQTRPNVYVNHPQTCTIFCSDGSPFSFTVPVGTFRSLTQAGADRAAYSYACRQAQLNAICLSSINASACVGQVYNQTIIANTANIPVSFSVVSGTIPDWMTTLVGPSSIRLSGTPDSGDIANVEFVIQAVDVFGFYMTKAYQISVTECVPLCSITESTLTAFDQGQAYSAQLHATGGTAPYSWALVEGQLPSGLSLSTGGLISGIADLTNGNLDQIFTVQATDSSNPASQCEKSITLPVVDYHNFPTGKRWRISGYFNGIFSLPMGCACALNPCSLWDGKFDAQLSSGRFSSSLNTVNGVEVQSASVLVELEINPNPGQWGDANWFLIVTCTVGGSNAFWYGRKNGSNLGIKLDSPAGVYDLAIGLIGQPNVCGDNATFTIEEYTA